MKQCWWDSATSSVSIPEWHWVNDGAQSIQRLSSGCQSDPKRRSSKYQVPLPSVFHSPHPFCLFHCAPSRRRRLTWSPLFPSSLHQIAINNFARYTFAAGASAGVLPCLNAIGPGWTNTAAGILGYVGAALVVVTLVYGERWRIKANEKYGVSYKEGDEMKQTTATTTTTAAGQGSNSQEEARPASPKGLAKTKSGKHR